MRFNGRMRLLGFFLLALLARMPGQEIAAGKILLASPDLPDPNFSQTVVLLIHTGDDGAMGLILNRPAKISLGKLFPGKEIPRNKGEFVYTGGPVEEQLGFALLRSSTKLKEALRVGADVYFVTDKDQLEKTVQTAKDAASFRVYLGYAGWGPDQLEQELAAGAWTVLPWRIETVFDADPLTLWDRLNEKNHLRIAGTTRETTHNAGRVSGPPE